MGILQTTLDQTLLDTPYKLIANIMADKIAAQGVTLTTREREKLFSHIRSQSYEVFRFRRWRWWDNQQLKIELTAADVEAVQDRMTEFIDTKLPELVTSAAEDISANHCR